MFAQFIAFIKRLFPHKKTLTSEMNRQTIKCLQMSI